MHGESRDDPGGRRLNTWKEIAGYFDCDERTVKRWEASRGLPVRRIPNGSRSAVFAYETELRAWLDNCGADGSEPESPQVDSGVVRGRALQLSYAVFGAILLAAMVLGQAVLHFTLPSGHNSAPAPHAAHVPNAEAQAFYRAGLFAWQTRSPTGLTEAVDDFTQAIVHDPQYAEAYAGLADCYNLLREYTTMAPEYAYPRAAAAAERAIALKPSLGGAHAALAFVDFYWLRDVTRARTEFRRAIALSPESADAHHWYATFLMTIGDSPHALAEITKAETLDTQSGAIRADKGLILFYAGQTDAAVALLRQLEQSQPVFASPHHYLAVIERARGNDATFLREFAAFAEARHDDADRAVAEAGAQGFAAGGHAGMLKAILKAQQRLFAEGAVSAYALATTSAELGEPAAALGYLRTSVSRGETDNVGLAIEPALASLRTNAAFRALESENRYDKASQRTLR